MIVEMAFFRMYSNMKHGEVLRIGLESVVGKGLESEKSRNKRLGELKERAKQAKGIYKGLKAEIAWEIRLTGGYVDKCKQFQKKKARREWKAEKIGCRVFC